MILLDTHTWVWWTAESEKLSSRASETIKKSSEMGVSAISCWEVAMLVAKGRLGLSMDVEEWIEKSLRLPEVRLLELTPKIAVLSTRLAGNPPGDPADRFLIATAMIHHCPIVTKDHLMRGYNQIETVW